MSGALMQLVAYGAQDTYLTGNPQISFFKASYRRYTNFSMQPMNVTAQGAVGFDKVMNFTIPRNGDLITNTYLLVKLAEISEKTFDGKFAWVKRLGHALIDYVTITIGGSQIDKQYGIWLDMWYELSHTKSHEAGYRKMIGDVPELTAFSTADAETGLIKKSAELFIPLQFWFCQNAGLALPLIALQYHEVKIELKTASKDKLVVFDVQSNFREKVLPKIEIADIKLLVNYVFLDSEERRKFAQVGHEYLIEQLQFTSSVPVPNTPITHQGSEIHHSVPLNFNHPTKELVWAVRNGNMINHPFLAYTDKEDWTDALDEAANNLAAGMFQVSTETGDITTESGTIEIDDHKINYTVADETQEQTGIKLDVNKTPLVLGKYNLAKKLDSVSITITDEGVKVIVLAHRITIRDISIPLTHWKDTRFVKSDVIVNIPFCYGLLIDGSVNPVVKGLIQLNGQDRFDEREGKFFNCVEPFQHHTATPADGINVYSFAIKPEEHQPSGTANLSRIDTTNLMLKYGDASQTLFEPSLGAFTSESQLFVFDKSYNVLRVMSGMAGTAYSN